MYKTITDFYPSLNKNNNKDGKNKRPLLNSKEELNYYLGTFPYDPSKDLKVAPSIIGEKKEYAVNKYGYSNVLNTILTKNKGITRLFYYHKNELLYYATIQIIKHKDILKNKKIEIQKKHPNWSTLYPWNYLIEFIIL